MLRCLFRTLKYLSSIWWMDKAFEQGKESSKRGTGRISWLVMFRGKG